MATNGAGVFFNPYSPTLYSQKNKTKFGTWVTKNVKSPGAGATWTTAPKGLQFPGVGKGNLPINPRDAQYFLNTSGARYELQNRLRPLQQKLSELGAEYGGRTQFDALRDQAKAQWNQGARGAMSSAAARGIYDSGMRGKTARDLAGQWHTTSLGLRQQYGDIARQRLRTEIEGQRRDFGRDILTMLLDASRRKAQYETGDFMPEVE